MAHSASFRRVSFRVVNALFLGVASSSLLLLGGCDSDVSKTDKKVTQQLDDASIQMTGSEADRIAASQELDAAARENSASLPQRIRAKAMLADNELHIAQGICKQIQSNDVVIDQLAHEIDLLAAQINTNNQTVAALAKHDPASVQAAVKQKSADVTGSDDKPDWYKSDAASLQSLSADDKQAAALQQQITTLQDQIKSESDQRNQLLDQADKLTQQSQHEPRDKALDSYTQGSNARKQAADLTVKLDQDNAALARAQADLTVRQGQHESLSTALKTFDDKSAFYAAEWQAVQKEQADLNDASKKLLGEDPATPPKADTKGDLKTDDTIASKSAAIAELAKENHALRSAAETHFNSAIGFYKDAFDRATDFRSELTAREGKVDPQKAEQAIWKEEQVTLDPSNFRYLQADADLQKAEFLARDAAEAKLRLDLLDRVKPYLAAAQLTVPASLDDGDGNIASQRKDAETAARKEFAAATDELQKTYEGTAPPEQRNAAQAEQVFAQYGWWLMEKNSSTPDPDADSHLGLAKNAVSAALGSNIPLPALPPALAEAAPTPPGPR